MNQLYDIIFVKPWPWWVGGPLIGIFVILLLIIERKQLGISSSYQYICAKVSPWKLDYFKEPEKNAWQFFFILGVIAGGAILSFLTPAYEIGISEETIVTLDQIGIHEQKGFAPAEIYNFSTSSLLVIGLGGVLLGFGARYANGCTAGHAIMGCAQLAPSSIITTIGFFVGGLLATYLIIPLIL
ncbi:MAG: YeeE/YedE family protein [Crocinitomicaceae bacterium]|nr:YeeE/YedE family protein [Crocinitomicaceae bacterium]